MGTVITWIVIFLILCGCIFLWTYMLHRGPHAGEGDAEIPSCDGNCMSCSANTRKQIHNPDECKDKPVTNS